MCKAQGQPGCAARATAPTAPVPACLLTPASTSAPGRPPLLSHTLQPPLPALAALSSPLHIAHGELAVTKIPPQLSPDSPPRGGGEQSLEHNPKHWAELSPHTCRAALGASAGALCLNISWPQWQPTRHRQICCLQEAATWANWSPPRQLQSYCSRSFT